MIRVSPAAVVDERAVIHDGASIWHYSQIREFAIVGQNTIIGMGVYVDSGVRIGQNCKIQNQVSIYNPAVIEDGVFLGPGSVLTNDKYPRATQLDLTVKSNLDWESVGVTIELGASIGAGSVLVAPLKVGRWALIAAGSVVTKDVPSFAMVAGNPARFRYWVGRAGLPLKKISENLLQCPVSSDVYELVDEKALVLL